VREGQENEVENTKDFLKFFMSVKRGGWEMMTAGKYGIEYIDANAMRCDGMNGLKLKDNREKTQPNPRDA